MGRTCFCKGNMQWVLRDFGVGWRNLCCPHMRLPAPLGVSFVANPDYMNTSGMSTLVKICASILM